MNNTIRLCDLKIGEVASILKISPENRIKDRLFDIGLIEGTAVGCLFRSPSGGMGAYLIRGACIAIRDGDVGDVLAERRDENGSD